jgi:peptidoglycan/LPS O-acetylase OafA/YrhL
VFAGATAIAVHLAYIAFPSIAPPFYGLRTETAASHLLISAGYLLMRKRTVAFVRPWMPLVALFAAIGCYTEIAPWWAPIILSPFLLAFAVNHLSETPRFIRSALAFAPLRLLGLWSYSIYLWQQPFYFSGRFILGHLGFHSESGQGAMACAAAISVGVLSFYFFENPTRTWLNKVW